MPDSTALRLPLRDYGTHAVTGLIANQASFAVRGAWRCGWRRPARPHAPEVVVGLPTLGQVFAPLVAEALGHANWVAPGYTRKLWYEDRLSVPLASSTAPATRLLWLDPRGGARLRGGACCWWTTCIASGAPRGWAGAAGEGGRAAGGAVRGDGAGRPLAGGVAVRVPVAAAFATPLYRRTPEGWVPMPETRRRRLRCRPHLIGARLVERHHGERRRSA
jgi:hypothetical protein